ncbi:unnamed protein product [Trifolium pratense]|uniref:Uncharacterized protein n=1 Tax=Trifolium pratense TaxID=57577 RepID=A0ACB0IV78_TRIPR|nr:unnamed protein product [Trifolium pratense]
MMSQEGVYYFNMMGLSKKRKRWALLLGLTRNQRKEMRFFFNNMTYNNKGGSREAWNGTRRAAALQDEND